jgi:threonine dehydratase
VLGSVNTIADGLAPTIVSQLTFEHALELVDDVVTVGDEAIRSAACLLIERQKTIVEFSGAAATAALLSRKLRVEGGRVAVVVSGGNMDPSLLAQLI